MRTFREALVVSGNLKATMALLESIEANGGDSMAFVEWITSDEFLAEARPAPPTNRNPRTNAASATGGFGIGYGSGVIAGAMSAAGRSVSQAVSSFGSGLAQGAKAGYRKAFSDLPSSAKNATDALKNLETRISQSPELKSLFTDPNFMKLLQDLQSTITNALVENARRAAVIQEAREYARIISELAEAGVDPSEVFGEFYEGEIQLNEILSSIWNYLKSWWTSGLKKIRDKADQQAISNAMQALAQLQQDVPAFGEKPSAEFEKFAQQFINAVQAATGGAPEAVTDPKVVKDLETRLKDGLADEADKKTVDKFLARGVAVVSKAKNLYFNKFGLAADSRDPVAENWFQTVRQLIIDNAGNPKAVESMINGWHSEKFFIKDAQTAGIAAARITNLSNILNGMTDKIAKYKMLSGVTQHAERYAGLVKKDANKMRGWYYAIVSEIIANKNPLLKAEEMERAEGGTPAATRAKAFMDALPTGTMNKRGGGTISRYDAVPEAQRVAFEKRFQMVYMAIGDNANSGKQILEKTVGYFVPSPKKDNAELFQQAFQKAMPEKIRDWYNAESGNNFDNELGDIKYEDQIKLVQKFNKALKNNVNVHDFWTDIGYKARNNQDYLESKAIRGMSLIESITGGKAARTSWFS